jgi:hypothetical protein
LTLEEDTVVLVEQDVGVEHDRAPCGPSRRPGAGPGSSRAPKAEQTGGWGHGPALHD